MEQMRQGDSNTILKEMEMAPCLLVVELYSGQGRRRRCVEEKVFTS
jgi:hypothetical protein